jgi:aminopeptidase N
MKSVKVLLIVLISSGLYGFSYNNNISDFEKEKFHSYKSSLTDSTIDVNYYNLFFDIHINPDYLYAQTEILCKVVQNPLNFVYLDLSNYLTVDSIKTGNSFLQFNHLNNKLTIILNRTYNPGEQIQMIIFYRGLPVPTGYGSFVFGTNINTPVIWTLSEPFGASDWFPCKNSPDDKADSSKMRIKCRNDFTAVSNGILESVTDNTDSTKTYEWKCNYPIANYLISLAVTNYEVYKNYFKYTPADSMPVVHYIYPQNLNGLKSQLDRTVDMLEFFSSKFGLYPFINEKYGHVQFGEYGGMEHQTVASMGLFYDGIMAHELAHQWFGDKITCRNWQNIWLNEGFATYSEALYNEHLYGKLIYDDFISYKMLEAKRARSSIYVQNPTNINEIFDADRSYSKGCVVLHMLRGVTGDTVFFRVLRKYSSDTALAFKTAVTEDFQSNAESVYGSSLAYFFQEWIYGENYPKYMINWSYIQDENNFYNVSFNLSQQSNSNPVFFTMPAEIKIKTEYGDTLINIFNNSQQQSYSFKVKGKPLSLTFDPGNKILKDKTGDEIAVPVRYYLGQNFPNPFNPATTINYEILKYSDVSLIVYDILGRIVKILVNEKQKPGAYIVRFSSENLPSGIYFYKIIAGEFTDSKKMLMIK